MKIAIVTLVSMLQTAAVVSAGGMPEAKKPPHAGRRGTVLAGGHRTPPRARRTTAMPHSKGHHPVPLTTEPTRATRGGAAKGVHHDAVKEKATKAPTPAPVSSPLAFDMFSPVSTDTTELPCPPPPEILEILGLSADDIDCEEDNDWLLEDDCAGLYNSTPPCPPTEILAILNLTLSELNCDSDVLPPCPYPELASQLGLDVDSLECDKEFWCFSHNHINVNTSIACPTDFVLFELEMLYGIWCEHNDTDSDSDWWPFPEMGNFTTVTIECEDPIPCSLPYADDANASGIVVCDASMLDLDFDSGYTMCIDPTEALESDTCGCCGGTCPEPCSGTECKLPVYYEDEDVSDTEASDSGVWLVDSEGGYAQCVTSQESAFMQLGGYFTCLDACST